MTGKHIAVHPYTSTLSNKKESITGMCKTRMTLQDMMLSEEKPVPKAIIYHMIPYI